MRRVLIVDDEPSMASLVAMCLDPLGVEVVQASGLSDAIEAARESAVSLVLLDLALGREDGLAILPCLRDEPMLSEVPVVAFSAHDSRRREALESGIDSFLRRPFAAADLQSTVKRYLGDP